MTDKELIRSALEALESCSGAPHWEALQPVVAALRKALANAALDKMADNARELGLDYEPAPVQEPVAMRHSFDGYGYKYTDMSFGGGWKEWTLKQHPDAEPVYAHSAAQPAPVQEPVIPEGFSLVAVKGFDELMYWLDRCERKGHLENCPDLIEPYEAFDYRTIDTTPPAAQLPDVLVYDGHETPQYIEGWNDCREFMKGMR